MACRAVSPVGPWLTWTLLSSQDPQVRTGVVALRSDEHCGALQDNHCRMTGMGPDIQSEYRRSGWVLKTILTWKKPPGAEPILSQCGKFSLDSGHIEY